MYQSTTIIKKRIESIWTEDFVFHFNSIIQQKYSEHNRIKDYEDLKKQKVIPN